MADNTKRIDDGGPAFPRTGFYPPTDGARGDDLRERIDTLTEPQPGLSRRDYIAAKAMQAVMGNAAFMKEAAAAKPHLGARDALAAFAYEVADSMIAASKPK